MTLTEEIDSYLSSPRAFPPEYLWWLRRFVEDVRRPALLPVIPATPTVQDIANVLVALGLAKQA